MSILILDCIVCEVNHVCNAIIVRVGLAHLFVVPERSPHPTQEQHFSTIFSLFKSSSLFIMHISTQTIS